MSQLNMFRNDTLGIQLDRGDSKVTLGFLVSLWHKEKLQAAPFQRDYIWDKQRRQGWAQTLISGKQMWGTFCLYTLRMNGVATPPYYLADGYQRLSCTLEILSDPASFGIDNTPDEILEALNGYPITIQNAEFDNHEEGFIRFKKVNMGCALHPAEYYRGYFINIPNGTQIVEDIERIVEKCDERIAIAPKRNPNSRNYNLSLRRGCYALLLQFITRTKSADMWGYSTTRINPNESDKVSVEEILVDKLRLMKPVEISQLLKTFESYLQITTATIEDRVFKHYNSHGAAISKTLFRALLHIGIWKRNTNWANQHFEQCIDLMLQKIDPSDGRIHIVHDDGTINTDSIRLASFTPMLRACEHYGIPTQRSPRASRKSRTRPGWDDSHILPFATNGNGETIPEPASRNRARGAKPIEGYADE